MKRLLNNKKLLLPISNVQLREYQVCLIQKKDATLPKRSRNTHKGSYGRVKVIAGSNTMIGASLLCSESAFACLRGGAGLVTLCVPSSLRQIYQARVKEFMLFFMSDNNGDVVFNSSELDEIIKGANTIVIGMGMGKNPEIIKILDYLLHNFNGTLVIDADALNALQFDTDILLNKTCNCILTPHVVEFNRLCKDKKPVIENIKQFCLTYNVVVIYKSAHSLISDGNNFYINTTGSPCMAKGGSGDVLAGLVGGLSASLPPLQAAYTAAYHFGKAGEKTSKQMHTDISVLASDIILRF